MIGRMWHGWTTRDNAAAYANLMENIVLPGIRYVSGYQGSWLLRRDVPEGVEFVTLIVFDSMEAVRDFAGSDLVKAVIPREAARLLSRHDESVVHYEVVVNPGDAR